MKFTILAGTLNSALAAVGSVIPDADPKPIVTCVRIEAADGAVAFRGSDLKADITRRITTEIATPGAICVVHSRIAAWAKTLPAEASIAVECDDVAFVAKSGRSRLRLPILDPAEFTPAPGVGDGAVMQIGMPGFLARLTGAAAGCASDKDTSDQLKGVCLRSRDGSLWFESADRRTALRLSLPAPTGARDLPEDGVVIHQTTVRQISAIFQDAPSAVVSVSADLVSIATDHTVFVSRLINATFPNIGILIDIERPTVISFDGPSMIRAVRRCLATRIADSKTTRMAIRIIGAELRISVGMAGDADGDAEDGVECQSPGDLEYTLSGKQALAQIEALGAETIELCLPDDRMGAYLMRGCPDTGAIAVGGAMR